MNKKLKWIAIFMSFLVMCSCLNVSVWSVSDTGEVVDLPPITDNSCGDNAFWQFIGSTGTLQIETLGGKEGKIDIQQAGQAGMNVPWHEYRDLIERIEIGEGIVSIGKEAFDDCSEVINVVLPESLKEIGDNAFSGCKITELILPANVVTIGSAAFAGCAGLKSIDYPESLKTIDAYAFSGCKSLTTVEIPDSVDRLSLGAFSNCSSLKSINLPDSIKKIEAGTFERCTALKSVVFPKALTEIESSAFAGCTNLKKAVIPKSVNSLDFNIFENCPKLEYAVILNSTCEISYDSAYDMSAIPEVIDIYGYRSSTAECYCQQNGNRFYAIDDLAVNGFLVLGDLKVDHDNNIITGIDSNNPSLEDVVNVSEQYVLNTSTNTIGTGTVITITDAVTGETVDTYNVVVSGDLNGDGVVDVFDQAVVAAVANGETQLSEHSAEFLAADLNNDGVLDVFDVSIITSAANYEI